MFNILFIDDLSQSNGTREDLLKFDMNFSLSCSQRGPVSKINN